MTSVKPSRGTPERGPDSSAYRSSKEITETLLARLSPFEKKQYRTLEGIYYRYTSKKTEKSKKSIAKAFASTLYSDNSKVYFAAEFVHSDLVLRFGDKFLSEETILGYLKQSGGWLISKSYIRAIMDSSHLSELIIETALEELGYDESPWILELTPDALITPKAISIWRSKAGRLYPYLPVEVQQRYLAEALSLAAFRVRKAHPEYEKFPDDWVLKVFCGE